MLPGSGAGGGRARRGGMLAVEPVASAPDGGDPVRPDLVTQVADVDLDDIGARVVVVSPDVAEQLLAAEHLARMPQEHLGQRELPRRQVDRVAGRLGLAGPQVETEAAVS